MMMDMLPDSPERSRRNFTLTSLDPFPTKRDNLPYRLMAEKPEGPIK
jgi:hypothetical protein